MDWEKVIKALDDEWFNRKQRAEQLTGIDDNERQRMIATSDIAFMLRDCLQSGLNK